MNLYRLLAQRAHDENPIRVGLIGCGKFATMFMAQARHTTGMHVAAIADLAPDRARANLARAGWPADRVEAASIDAAIQAQTIHVGDDTEALLHTGTIDVVVEATGDPAAGLAHATAAIDNGKHVVMVNVEADVLAGLPLAERAREAGLVYSLAYGDQPALICEMVDWARACGFPVVCAGKGTRYMPHFHQSTPDTVWEYFGITPEEAAAGGMNPKMFNSFIDGTKSAIEMTAVANATGLDAPEHGLAFPPCATEHLPLVLRPRADGGTIQHAGMVEVVSDFERDGRPVTGHLRNGVYVVFEAPGNYAARCFHEYKLHTDPSGRYAALARSHHLIGLELAISVASAALRGEPTGAPQAFHADAVATAKRPLRAGEVLDGEGGLCVYGRIMPATASVAAGALPIGLANGVALGRDIAAGTIVRYEDVGIDETGAHVRLRREMEAMAA